MNNIISPHPSLPKRETKNDAEVFIIDPIDYAKTHKKPG